LLFKAYLLVRNQAPKLFSVVFTRLKRLEMAWFKKSLAWRIGGTPLEFSSCLALRLDSLKRFCSLD
jgi:hypothetical protein